MERTEGMKKRYERPAVIASYTAKDLKAEAALVVANSYTGEPGWQQYP
jgi:hypothetical protein